MCNASGTPEEIDIAELEKYAESGDIDAQYQLGLLNDTEGCKSEAAEWYSKASENGHPGAKCNLANLYLRGDGVAVDKEKAFELYTEAADAGNIDAMHNLGLMYENGDGVEQNTELANELFERSAELGDSCSFYILGNKVFDSDMKAAAELFNKAAAGGHTGAMCNLAFMYYNGYGVEQDLTKAARIYGFAAELGNPAAMYYLSGMYGRGEGVEKDDSVAKQLAEKAAESGFVPDQ
jgi:TPR repeat protein